MAGKVGIELDGVMAGWIFSAEGGHATADVVTEKLGPDHIAKKPIQSVKSETISFTCGAGMSKAVYDWIKGFVMGKQARKSGAILQATFDHKEVSRIAFSQALITEVGFPALDAASKDPAKMTLTLAPETSKVIAAPAGVAGITPPSGAPSEIPWLCSSFRLQVAGLDCSRVNKIEAFAIKQKVVEHPVGEASTLAKEPGKLEFPNLVITFPESHAADLYAWHEDFVIKGNNGDDKEKNGTLELLGPDMKDALFTLTFRKLGILKLTPEKVEAGSENIRRVKAEMYCEEMKFDYKAAWA